MLEVTAGSDHQSNTLCVRVPGDTLFANGALISWWFVSGLVTGHSYDVSGEVVEGE
ncbi:MAG TPA: hypothetical protein VF786_12005 [Terriglobales bacterium]